MDRRFRNVAWIGLVAWCVGAGTLHAAGMYHATNLGSLYASKLNDAGQVIANNYDGSMPVISPDGVAAGYGNVASRYNAYGPDAGKVERIGGGTTTVLAQNNRGQLLTQEGNRYALVDGQRSTPIDVQSGGSAARLNDSGQVLGSGFTAPDGSATGLAIWQAGQVTPLADVPNSTGIYYGSLGNAGQVVGGSYFADGTLRGYLWDGGEARDLGSLGGRTLARDVNASGVVVGSSDISAANWHAFAHRDGVMTDLGTLPGHYGSQAVAINDAGDIVGTSLGAPDGSRGFLYRDGRMIDLNTLIAEDLGLTITSAIDINAQGQILGFATDRKTGSSNALLLTPDGQPIPADPTITPEPSSLALAALILAAAGAHRARARRRS